MRRERAVIAAHRWRGDVVGDRQTITGLAAQRVLRAGMAQITGVLRPTLGPIARTVAISSEIRTRPPEILDHGAVIARRVNELDNADENMGAMLLRHALWKVQERVGDGSATTAVLAQALMDRAVTYLAAGGDPIAIRRGIDQGVKCVVQELERMARPIDSPEEIARLVQGIVGDDEIAHLLGEVLDTVGADGMIEIEDGYNSDVTCEYVDGVRWREGIVSPYFLVDGATTTAIDHPRIFATDHPLISAADLVPVIEACLLGNHRSLAVIAPEIRDEALALLIVNRERGVLDEVLALKAPGVSPHTNPLIEDLAVITGARLFRNAEGRLPKTIQLNELGGARQVWSNRTLSGILGGAGDQVLRRQRSRDLRAQLPLADDDATRAALRERLGRLNGIVANVRVGGGETERAERKHRISAAVATGRAALREGVVPGAGAAFIHCQTTLATAALGEDEVAGRRMLAQALSAPAVAIAANAGFEPFPIIDKLQRAPSAGVFDVVRREWVDPWTSGPVDAVAVSRLCLEMAAGCVGAAINIGALVRPRTPEVSLKP